MANLRKTVWFKIVLVVILTSITCKSASNNSGKKLICYFSSNSMYRPKLGKFSVDLIDPFLCSHLIYSFAGLSHKNTIRSLDEVLDLPAYGNNYGRFNDLKKVNPDLKTLLAIGGWYEGSRKYSEMASDSKSRKTFIDSVVDFLKLHKFDGLDMAWKYPGTNGGQAEDKENFIALLKELREAFIPHNLLLTIAASAEKPTIDVAYNVNEITKYIDFINLMTYDFNTEWTNLTCHHSPLYARPYESSDQKLLNVNWTVNFWISLGAPKEKILVGLGTFGKSFTLGSPDRNGVHDAATQVGEKGPYTNDPGFLGYNEICEDKNWTVVRENYYKVPYAYKDRQWVGFDDEESFKVKVDYVKTMNVGGIVVWSLDTDDFHGKCQNVSYPLIKIIQRELFETSPTEVTTVTIILECESEGYFRDPNDCSIYWRCYKSGNELVAQEFKCEEGTVFDLISNTCNWPQNVDGCHD